MDGFHGVWLHFQRARVGLCLVRLWAKYRLVSTTWTLESLPLVLKDRRSCFSEGERFAVQLPLDRTLALRK